MTGEEAFGAMFETCKLFLGERANSIRTQCKSSWIQWKGSHRVQYALDLCLV